MTADISKILKNVFDILSESRIGFVSFFIFFLAVEKIASFTKTPSIENKAV